MLYRLFRPALYALSAETAHHLVLAVMSLVARSRMLCGLVRALFAPRDPRLAVDAMGQHFASPIGLAAGLDKDAVAFNAFAALGFGFVEVGTVTAQAQPGNPRPRLFRLVDDRALINRMGFNNCGAVEAAARLQRLAGRARMAPLGINIGKTKIVANEAALDDYARSAELLAPFADYLVVNVSSPNTPGLRDLQTVTSLRPLLEKIRNVLDTKHSATRVPLLLKIAPDLADEDIDAIADLALALRLDGIIATNTTIGRAGLRSDPRQVEACGAGGLSGAPLKARAVAVLKRLYSRVGEQVTLIAAGGIESADDVWQRLSAGASLVQIYTALVYEGPTLPSRLARDLAERMRAKNISSISELRRQPQT